MLRVTVTLITLGECQTSWKFVMFNKLTRETKDQGFTSGLFGTVPDLFTVLG